MDVKIREKIVVEVESDLESGKTVMINVDNRVLPVGWIRRILVDGNEIGEADGYADVLDPTDEDLPEYYILKGGRGAKILVSIPRFSVRTITITALPAPPVIAIPVAMILLAYAIILMLVLSVLVVYRYLSTKRIPPQTSQPKPEQSASASA